MSYYVGICSEKGNFVEEDEALFYALCRILDRHKEAEEFLEWYYSGNWINYLLEEE